jgi:hypothetical protein
MQNYGRTRQRFPSRQYAYGRPGAFTHFALEQGKMYQFILGRDREPRIISPADGRARLADPFAQLVLFSGDPLPGSLRALLAQLDRFNADAGRGLPEQRSFVVADGGQIPWTEATDDLERAFRFAIIRQRTGGSEPDLLISASTNIDSDEAFLQVIGWDAAAGAFQFYERRDGAWVWAGSSWDALDLMSRGQGPFDSHVNGALNMKELKQPWVNWNSMAARIRDTALAPDDPLRNELLWTGRSGAEVFETEVVRPGIRRWNDARFQRLSESGRLIRLPEFMRQVLGTSTVNLTSSTTSNARLATAQSVPLPLTFFINSDALVNVIGLEPNINPPQASAAVYRAVLQKFDVALTDGNHRFPGDTNFVFVVPEPAFEDVLVLETLLSLGVMSRKMAASLLMVDFPNAVFSPRRAALLQYVPESSTLQGPADFERAFVDNVQQAVATGTAGEPEHAFLENLALASNEWEKDFARRIEAFFQALAPQFTDADLFAKIFALAESRRREFRKRPLAEFRLTIPVTNIPDDAPLVEFTQAGEIQPKT